MAAENFDGYAHVDKLMRKALEEEAPKEEIKEAYAAWAKTYEKVNRNVLNSGPDNLVTASIACKILSLFPWWEVCFFCARDSRKATHFAPQVL